MPLLSIPDTGLRRPNSFIVTPRLLWMRPCPALSKNTQFFLSELSESQKKL
jgi:hypothetical protein